MRAMSYLSWPFFEPRHRALAEKIDAWVAANLAEVDDRDVDATCRKLVALPGRDGWLQHTPPGECEADKIDGRTLALRISEGASDVQKIVIARSVLSSAEG